MTTPKPYKELSERERFLPGCIYDNGMLVYVGEGNEDRFCREMNAQRVIVVDPPVGQPAASTKSHMIPVPAGRLRAAIGLLEYVGSGQSIAASHCAEVAADLERALAGQSEGGAEPVAPQGWKLVPIEPTDEMLVTGQEAFAAMPRGAIEDCEESNAIYRAMLAAAPGKEG